MSAIRSNSNRTQSRKARTNPYARVVVRSVYRLFGWKYDNDDDAPTTREPMIPQVIIDSTRGRTDQPNDNANALGSDTAESDAGESFTNNKTESRLPPAQIHEITQSGGNTRNLTKISRSSDAIMAAPTRPLFTFPALVRSSSSPSLTVDQPKTPAPKRTLAKNPNGNYRLQGAGSAKTGRTRNRINSPAFRASLPSKPNPLVKDTPTGDAKRRKFGEETFTNFQPSISGSTQQSHVVPFPTSSSQTSHATTTPAKATSASSRLRTPAKPTAPVVPSPLRNAWSDASSTSSREETKSSPGQTSAAKQTQTANFMAELIKETKPPSKPDLSNPYQTASPVAKIGPPRRSKRTRAAGKSSPLAVENKPEEKSKKDEEKKLSDYSPQAIIEATVPKGSKRSRPPTHFDKPSSPTEEKLPYVVEEPTEDEDNRRPMKKSKPSVTGIGLPSSVVLVTATPQVTSDITVEEISEDVSMQDPEAEKSNELPKVNTNSGSGSASSPTSSRGSVSGSGFKPSSIPKEPSKLRFSFQADASTPPSPAPASFVSLPQTTPPSLPQTDFKFTVPSAGNFNFKVDDRATSPKSQSAPLKTEPKEMNNADSIKAQVRALDVTSLPTFSLSFDSTSAALVDLKAQNDARILSKTSLPSFTFNWGAPTAFSFGFDPSQVKSNPTYVFKPSPPKPVKPVVPFPSSVTSNASSFAFGEASKPSPAPVKGFDFAAAGMKVPTVSKDSWTCSLCALANPASASECQTCESPRSGSSSSIAPPAAPPAPPATGFNWGAAGLKAPTVNKDSWTCSLCALSNPASASDCQTCETPRSGATTSASTAPTPAPAPAPPAPAPAPAPVPVVGFNWGAAGIKAPTVSKDSWTCSLCALVNPQSANKCTTCENPR